MTNLIYIICRDINSVYLFEELFNYLKIIERYQLARPPMISEFGSSISLGTTTKNVDFFPGIYIYINLYTVGPPVMFVGFEPPLNYKL